MYHHVSLELTTCFAGVVALFADGRLLPTMYQHVCFQMRRFDGCVAALVASVGLLSTMLKHVRVEVFGHLEREIIALNT